MQTNHQITLNTCDGKMVQFICKSKPLLNNEFILTCWKKKKINICLQGFSHLFTLKFFKNICYFKYQVFVFIFLMKTFALSLLIINDYRWRDMFFIEILVLVYIHIHVPMHIYIWKHIYIHIYINIDTYIHIYHIHAHKHTYFYRHVLNTSTRYHL
jgi:hypothetical protein